MARYIDADIAKQEFNVGFGGVSHAVIANQIIDSVPTADVVEVVRCKDCAHYQGIKGFVYDGKHAKHCVWHSALRYDNDYCSDGMRKKEGEQ